MAIVEHSDNASLDSETFVSQWSPNLKKTHMSFCLPFALPALLCLLVWFFKLPQPGAFVLCAWSIVGAIVYIVKSQVCPGEFLKRYGWLQWDRMENQKVEAEQLFVEALMSTGIITKETKAKNVYYEIKPSAPGTLFIEFDIRQSGATFQNIQNKIAATAPALGAYSVETKRIGNTRYEILYSFADPAELYREGASDTVERVAGDPFRIAYHEPGREPITLPSDRSFRAIVAGSSGSGKSVCVQKLLCEIAQAGNDHQGVILDPKRVSFVGFAPRFSVVADPDKFTDALEALYAEMMRRYDWMQTHGVQEIPLSEMPMIYVLVDEVAELFDSAADKKDKDLRIKRLTQLATLSRQANFCLILATQHPSTEILPSSLRGQLDFRVVLRMYNKRQVELVCPDELIAECPAYLIAENMPGVGYFLTPSTGNHFSMGRVYRFEMEEAENIINEYAHDKIEFPWLADALPLSSDGGSVVE